MISSRREVMFGTCFGHSKTEPQKVFSVPLQNQRFVEGESEIRRHPLVADTDLCSINEPNIQTLHDLFQKSSNEYKDRNFLGTRSITSGKPGPYEWKNYGEIWTQVENFSSGLIIRGLGLDENIGLFSVNRLEWVVTEYACYRAGLVTVPLYDTLGAESIVYICNITEMSHIVASKEKAMTILRNQADLPHLKTIIVMDSDIEELVPLVSEGGIELVLFSTVEENGMKTKQSPRPPAPNNLCTICYTSGTTGMPKGAMITHSNIISVLSALDLLIRNKKIFSLDSNDIHLSYLPLPHIFERVIMSLLIQQGASIGFYQGDTLKILDDVMELGPTIFISVPRLFNRIYDRVKAGLKKGTKLNFLSGKTLLEYIFDWAYQTKVRKLARGDFTHWIWDRLIFSKNRAKLGGNVRGMLTGSAPIAGEVLNFLRICFS